MIFSITIVMFPTTPTVATAGNMNYTIAVAGAWLLLCVVYYYFPKFGGAYWFKGPVANVEVDTPAAEKVSVTYEEASDVQTEWKENYGETTIRDVT